MFVRYFCPTDDSELGRHARARLEAMLEIGLPVRLISNRAAQVQPARGSQRASSWARHASLLVTPMVGGYWNVVTGLPNDWKRLHTPSARANILFALEPPAEGAVAGALAIDATRKDGTRETHTAGQPEPARVAAARYEIVVPTEEISARWSAIGVTVRVIPMTGGELAALFPLPGATP